MDSLLWNRLNYQVKISSTKKKFFNKYLYKIKIFVPGGRLIVHNRYADFATAIDKRIDRMREINYGGSWAYNAYNRNRGIDQADPDQLTYFKSLKENNKHLHFRIEEPHINIYAENEQDLYTVAQVYPLALIEVERPSSKQAEEVLNRGEVLVKKDNGYQYKISLREHKITNKEGLAQVYEYLRTLDKDVKILKSCQYYLTNSKYWFNSCYFYANDPKVCTFIELIFPNLIQEISKLTVLKK